jgi:hypothetical protein
MATKELYEDFSKIRAFHPTGYKFCRGCGWRRIGDFGIAKRVNGVPHHLQPVCRTCKRLGHRKETGAVPIGSPRPKSIREKIAKGQERRWAPYIDEIIPEGRVCNKCKVFKKASKFTLQKHIRKNGEYRYTLASQCKLCRAKAAETTRNNLSKEEKEQRRVKDRVRMKMKKNSVVSIAKPSFRRTEANPYIDPAPFLVWLESILREYRIEALGDEANVGAMMTFCNNVAGADYNPDTIRRTIDRAREEKRITRNFVDHATNIISGPGKFFELYPEDALQLQLVA